MNDASKAKVPATPAEAAVDGAVTMSPSVPVPTGRLSTLSTVDVGERRTYDPPPEGGWVLMTPSIPLLPRLIIGVPVGPLPAKEAFPAAVVMALPSENWPAMYKPLLLTPTP